MSWPLWSSWCHPVTCLVPPCHPPVSPCHPPGADRSQLLVASPRDDEWGRGCGVSLMIRVMGSDRFFGGSSAALSEVLTDTPKMHHGRIRCSQKDFSWRGNKSLPDKHWHEELVASAPSERPSASAVLGLHHSPSDPHLVRHFPHLHTHWEPGRVGIFPRGWRRSKKSNCRRRVSSS